MGKNEEGDERNHRRLRSNLHQLLLHRSGFHIRAETPRSVYWEDMLEEERKNNCQWNRTLDVHFGLG